MRVQMNNDWRITTDRDNWIVQQLGSTKTGKDRWQNMAYLTTLDDAITWCCRHRIKMSLTAYHADALPVLVAFLDEMRAEVKAIGKRVAA